MTKLHGARRLAVVLAMALAVCLAFSLSLASASGQATVTRLVVATTLSTSSLDPSVDTSNWGTDALGFETLLRVTPAGQLAPNLAVKVTRPGPHVYVYHLRRGVKFWDGAEMTAVDVANSLNYERHPGFYSSALFTQTIKSIVPVGRYKVAVTLKRPDASWQYVPATGYIFEKKYQDAHKQDHGKPGVLMMGTGAYKFVSLDPTSGAELVANSDYWGGKPSYQRVSINYFADETSEALAFRAGDVDFAFVNGDQRAFATTSKATVLTRATGAISFLAMNQEVPQWADIHVRRAVAYAVNRADIISVAVGGRAVPAYAIIPPVQLESVAPKAQVDALFKSLPQYRFNLQKAKQELALSKYPNGFSMELITVEYGSWVQTSEAIAGDLAKIGIHLNVQVLPYNRFIAKWSNLALRCNFDGTIALSLDPARNADYLVNSASAVPGGFNFSHYKNPAIDALLKAGTASSVGSKRFAAYSQVLKILGRDVPYVPLYQTPVAVALSSKFKFPTFNSFSNYVSTPVALEVRPK